MLGQSQQACQSPGLSPICCFREHSRASLPSPCSATGPGRSGSASTTCAPLPPQGRLCPSVKQQQSKRGWSRHLVQTRGQGGVVAGNRFLGSFQSASSPLFLKVRERVYPFFMSGASVSYSTPISPTGFQTS